MTSIRISCLSTLAIAAGIVYAQPTITSVVDPYTGGTKLAPGGQAVITGTALANGGVVTVGGVNAFILVPPQLGPTMTIEIPVTAAPGASVPVIVTTGAGPSAPFNITLTQYAPVLINLTSGPLTSPRHSSTGVAVTAATPAAAGETIVFYAIGLGPTNPVVNTGALGPPSPFAVTTTTPTVSLGANAVPGATARLANGQAFFGASASSGLTGSATAFIGVYVVSFVVPAGTAAGSYQASLSIGGVTSNSVSLSVGAAPTGPVITAIVSESGKTTLCPGDVAILSGLNLGTNPTVTVGTKTAFNINPPDSGNQMTIQIPVDAPLGNANVVLALGTGQSSAPFAITLTQYAPALLPGGNGSPVVPFHLTNGAPVVPSNPAIPGETIGISAYGLGPTNPVLPTGTSASNGSSVPDTTMPTVTIGGSQAAVEFAGLAPGQVGQYFVSFAVPPTLTSGSYPTWITAGGVTTNVVIVNVFTGPTINNVTNAASNITAGLPNAGIAQGAIFLIFGNNLGPNPISIAQNAFQSASLSGTSISVTVNGTTVAPLLYYTSATQVGALLPSNTPVGTGTISVTYNGQPGLAAPITVVANNLGIFTVTSDGQGVGIVTNADYSLVSVMPGTPCGGPYTTCGAANPGDTLILWATGLGPVNGSDAAGAGLGVPMPNIPLTLWVGGVQATVAYQGRSGCCIGEDQIVFTVPANAPLGCAVPLAVQIGNQVSNYTVMAVAPKGSRTCTAASSIFSSSTVQQVTTSGGAFNFGQIQLQRQPNSDNQVGAAGNTDYGKAVFASFTVPTTLQPFIISYLDDLPLGTCMVYNTTNPQGGSAYFSTFTPLDAGPGIKVTGPNGSQTIPPNANGQTTLSAAGTFLSPGAYTLTGTGGANVGAFTQAYTIPVPPTLTNPTTGPNGPPVAVTRTNGFTFYWQSGSSVNYYIQIQGGNSTDNTGTVGTSFTCNVAAGDGIFTIPPAVLLTLPPGAFVNSEWNFAAYTHYGSFSPSGLNLGFVQMSYNTAVFTLLQ